jgi:predicted TIM-barrel fold metal-dependent hydrolase
VILSHCHVGPPEYFRRLENGGEAKDGTLVALKRYLGELGFERAVVFAPFAGWFDGDPNAWLVEAVRDDRQFIPWMTLNRPGPSAAADLRRLAPRGIRGIKFHPPVVRIAIDDPGVDEFYAVAEAMRIPVLYHTGPHGWFLDRYRPLLVDRVAQKFPKLPLIIEHLGGEAFVQETLAVMQNNRNVYAGLATCLPEHSSWHVPTPDVARLIRTFGADRFVFGADFPYNSVEENRGALAILAGMGLPPPDVRLIMSGNLDRLNEGVAIP